MTTRFSEDVTPLTDLEVNPGRVLKHATESHRPKSNFMALLDAAGWV
jgi:hypothetical protein